MADKTGPFTSEFKSFLSDVTSHFHTPSMAIGVLDADETFFNVSGDADVSGQKSNKDTLYYLASVSKSFTATTLLGVLEEQKDVPGAIGLKSKLSSIIPDDFVLPDEYATKHATLEDALGHLLGLAPHNWNYGGPDYGVRDVVRSLRHLTMATKLRQKQEYLNMGYMVIQHVIETLTKKPIEDSHRKHIWDPLGMESTYVSLKDAKASGKQLATGYTWNHRDERLQVSPYNDDYPLVGGGGLICSIEDLTTYLQAAMQKKFPLSEKSHDELFKPRSIDDDLPPEHRTAGMYALGWAVSTYRGHRFISHAGGINGFSSLLAFLPEKNWGVALLTNSDGGGSFANSAVMTRLIEDALRVAPANRQDLVTKYDRRIQIRREMYLNARRELFPSLPNPPLPLMLPLSSYAGSYHNAGYRTLTLEIRPPRRDTPVSSHTKEVLYVHIGRLMDLVLELEHVSGEHFMVWADAETENEMLRVGTTARFIVGIDGGVQKWGIDLDLTSSVEAGKMMVWFDRVE